jgi:hypothetical protein
MLIFLKFKLKVIGLGMVADANLPATLEVEIGRPQLEVNQGKKVVRPLFNRTRWAW